MNTFEDVVRYMAKYAPVCDELDKLGFNAYIQVERDGVPTLVIRKVLYTPNGYGVSDPK